MFLYGTHQTGALQNRTAATAATGRPQRGRSAAKASHRIAGTTHTMWWIHEMGDTMRHVAAAMRTPNSGDERRWASAASQRPTEAATTSNGSMTALGSTVCATRSRTDQRFWLSTMDRSPARPGRKIAFVQKALDEAGDTTKVATWHAMNVIVQMTAPRQRRVSNR